MKYYFSSVSNEFINRGELKAIFHNSTDGISDSMISFWNVDNYNLHDQFLKIRKDSIPLGF